MSIQQLANEFAKLRDYQDTVISLGNNIGPLLADELKLLLN